MTLEVKHCEDELATLAAVMQALGQKDVELAKRIIIARQDKLLERPRVKPLMEFA